jgi:hypothetical protein
VAAGEALEFLKSNPGRDIIYKSFVGIPCAARERMRRQGFRVRNIHQRETQLLIVHLFRNRRLMLMGARMAAGTDSKNDMEFLVGFRLKAEF